METNGSDKEVKRTGRDLDPALRSYIINVLRRGSYRYRPRNDCLKASKIDYNQYKCARCDGVFTRKEVQIDHIRGVVGPEGFTTFDEYITRLFCPLEELQTMCKVCHKEKTLTENEERKAYRESVKKLDK